MSMTDYRDGARAERERIIRIIEAWREPYVWDQYITKHKLLDSIREDA